MDTYAYLFGGNLYLNLTNRCCNDCEFCIRRNGEGVGDARLWLSREPTAAEVIAAAAAFSPDSYLDAVFCGYGEPTYRLDALKEVAAHFHTLGKRVRLNTNGLGSEINGRNVAPELIGLVDTVSVSLNEASADKYDAVCHSVYGAAAFDKILAFTAACVREGIETVMTVVDVISPADIEACKQIAASVGAKLRVRHFISDNVKYE